MGSQGRGPVGSPVWSPFAVNGDQIAANAGRFMETAGQLTMNRAAVTENPEPFTVICREITETRGRFTVFPRVTSARRAPAWGW
jgi:hypothetical protein